MQPYATPLFLALLAGGICAQHTFPNSPPSTSPPGVGIGTQSPDSSVRLHVEAADTSGDRERIARFAVAGASGAVLEIRNGIQTAAGFQPVLNGHRNDPGASLVLIGSIDGMQDSAPGPVTIFDSRSYRDYFSTGSGPVSSSAIQQRSLFWWTNNSQPQMAMNASGFLGIGTTTPSEQLHTMRGVRFEGVAAQPAGSDTRFLTIDTSGVVHWRTGGGGGGGVSNSCTKVGTLPRTVAANGDLGCSQITDDGSLVRIADTNSTTTYGTTPLKLRVNGSTHITGSAFITSDERVKRNVRPITRATQLLDGIEGVSYELRTEEFPELHLTPGRTYGVLAQQVQAVLPELVLTSDAGDLAVNYDGLIPVLIAALKEQQAAITDLRTQVEQLQSAP